MSTEHTHDDHLEQSDETEQHREDGDEFAMEDDRPEQVDVDHAPSRLAQGLSVGGAFVGALLTAPFATLALPFGLAGFVMVIGSMITVYSIRWLSLGTGMILVGALISGAFGASPPEFMLLAVGAAVLGWDAGQHGIVVGRQLGRQTRTQRNELVHVAGSALVVGVGSGSAYFLFLFGASGRPGPAVALLVIGTVVLTWLLRS